MLIQTICSHLFDTPSGVIMRIAGRKDNGDSVLMNVHGFCPSFYILPDRDSDSADYDGYLKFMNILRDSLPTWQEGVEAKDLIWLERNEAVQSWQCGNGFQDGLKYKFYKLSFNSKVLYNSVLSLMRFPGKCRLLTTKYPRLQVYDADTDVQVKSLAISGIRATGWVKVTGEPTYTKNNDRTTIEFDCSLATPQRNHLIIVEPVHIDRISPAIKVMTFDFEVYSSIKGVFPDATRPKDCIYQASMVFKSTLGTLKKYLLHLFETDAVEDTIMIKCSSEAQLMFRFKTIINSEDPDIMTGHNITGFDWGYYFDRCDLLRLSSDMRDFSRIPFQRCTAETDTFKSKQVVAISRKLLYCPGRLNIDFQIWIERNKPPNHYANYRLETIAQKELKQGKDNVSAEEMFAAYESRCPKQLGLVAKYCIQDSVLVDRLLTKLNVVIQLFAMAYSANVPVSYLMEKGQTVKANSELIAEGYTEGVLLPKLNASSEAIEGATVHPIVPGIYQQTLCLDFGSLYPSIMITNSICPTTIVNSDKYLNLPGVEYNTINWQKRIYTRKSNDSQQLTFTSFQSALAQFCHDDIKMRRIIGNAILVLSDPIEETVLHVLETSPIKDVLNTLKELGNAKLHTFMRDIRSRYKECLAEFEILLDLDFFAEIDDSMEDDPDDDFWTTLAEKKAKRKICFSNKKKSKYEWRTGLVEEKYIYVANRSCLIKKILVRVLGKRKEVRKKQKLLEGSLDQEDMLLYAVYEGQQLAYKVTANSIFGALKLRDYRLGASITGEGRKMLKQVSDAAVTDFPLYLQKQRWTKDDVDAMIPDGQQFSPIYPSAIEGKPFCERLISIKVIGGDTDSIFVTFEGATTNETISWGNKGSAFFSSLFKEGIKMEYEKVWNPYIAIAKKKGIGRKYVNNDHDWTMELKGVETKRRNYCPALKETLMQVFKIVLNAENNSLAGIEDALIYVRGQLTNLLNGKIPMEELLISTKLNTTYKQEHLPGLDLVKRMRERKDFNTPEVGARFQFLYVYDKKSAPKEQFKRSEDLHFAKANNLAPDIIYYMEKQFKNPILGFLEVLMPEMIEKSKAERLFIEMISKAEAARKGNQSLTRFFEKLSTFSSNSGIQKLPAVANKRKFVQQKLGFTCKKQNQR